MSDCIEWAGYRGANGYGGEWYCQKWVRAHRAAYCEANGLQLSDIEGKVVMHTCDNPPCVNPDHLVLGSQLENIADCHTKGRTARGESKSNAKLDDARVWYMRARYALGGKTITGLAKEFGVDRSVVSRILAGQAWEHV